MHQMFSVHTTPEESNNATITTHFGFVFEETRAEKSPHHSKHGMQLAIRPCADSRDQSVIWSLGWSKAIRMAFMQREVVSPVLESETTSLWHYAGPEPHIIAHDE